jgi:Family of unknown function (DUF695)
MSKSNRAQAALTWFGAEGRQSGKPVLVRGRRFPPEVIGSPKFPYIVSIVYKYATSDHTGLPSVDQYDKIAEFENRAVDLIESAKHGFIALIKTFNGAVRYLSYVRDADATLRLLSQHLSEEDPVDLEVGEDREWAGYRRHMSRITDAGFPKKTRQKGR